VKILVDENIPLMTVRALTDLGHDVCDIRGTEFEGIDDDALWGIARQQDRLIVTTDKAFAKHRSEQHDGILVIRLRHPNRQAIHERVLDALADIPESDWPGTTVMARDRVRSVWRKPGQSTA